MKVLMRSYIYVYFSNVKKKKLFEQILKNTFMFIVSGSIDRHETKLSVEICFVNLEKFKKLGTVVFETCRVKDILHSFLPFLVNT